MALGRDDVTRYVPAGRVSGTEMSAASVVVDPPAREIALVVTTLLCDVAPYVVTWSVTERDEILVTLAVSKPRPEKSRTT
jgi:hypothetical protein